jgi:aldehyde dehydrogenase (NAD+)
VAHYDAVFIGGEWVAPAGRGRIAVENPATEEVVAEVAEGSAADVDRAVAAARAAFPGWSALSRAQRAEHLQALAARLDARKEEMAALITSEMGAPAALSAFVQVGLPLGVLQSYIGGLRGEEATEKVGNSMVVHSPVGVVGAITPWNYPLHQTMAKVAAALAAGCTVVHKPSEVAPLSAYLLAELFEEAGIPGGVYNLVVGYGPVVGEAMAAHRDIDMVSFTGSTAAGKRVSQVASATVKRVALELGGKSANVILPDADLTAAVKTGVGNFLLNTGQTCTAWTRMLVPADRQDEAIAIATAAASKYTTGDPNDPTTRLGPLVSSTQRDRVRGYIEKGVQEGAKLVLDGREGQPERGYFVGPTIFANVDPQSTIAQEEIFGPVLSIIPYTDEADALRIANDTIYGLAGGVWSADTNHAVAFARQMRTGQVDINGGAFNPLAPFGGFKQSGNGRELGAHGLTEFQETQSLQLPA